VAVRKEIFRWQLVANREVSGSPKVSRVPHHPPKQEPPKKPVFILPKKHARGAKPSLVLKVAVSALPVRLFGTYQGRFAR
jgi:hypothetical protein